MAQTKRLLTPNIDEAVSTKTNMCYWWEYKMMQPFWENGSFL